MPELKIEDLDHTDVLFCARTLLRRPRWSTNNPRLFALAAKVRLDAFTKVKKAIEDEIKYKDDFLVEERMRTATKNRSNTGKDCISPAQITKATAAVHGSHLCCAVRS